jgi:hypothetical protein
VRGVPIGYCLAEDCQYDAATHLGVCEAHWRALPIELRNAWWQAWHVDGRKAEWLEARRAALDWLRGNAA